MRQKAKLLFTSSRPISWVNTAYPFAAGYLFFTGRFDLTFFLGTLFFLIPYNLLMYGINDVYDYESDLRNPRKGGIEGGVVPKKYHRLILSWSYLLPLPFVIALITLGGWQSALVLLGCLFFVIAYSAKGLRFKEIPVLDSITSSLHFVGPLIYALSLVGWPLEVWPVVIAFFFWGVASQSFGAIQDIISDRHARIRSIATVLGARATLWFAIAAYALACIVIATTGRCGFIVALVGAAYIANLLPYLRITDKTSEQLRSAWKRFLWINYCAGAVVTIVLILSCGFSLLP